MKQEKITYIEELKRFEGEVDFSKLSDADFKQLMVRYFNDMCTYLKNITLFSAQNAEMLRWLCEKNGIDVKTKRAETAKMLQKAMDENLEKSKQAIKDSIKN